MKKDINEDFKTHGRHSKNEQDGHDWPHNPRHEDIGNPVNPSRKEISHPTSLCGQWPLGSERIQSIRKRTLSTNRPTKGCSNRIVQDSTPALQAELAANRQARLLLARYNNSMTLARSVAA